MMLLENREKVIWSKFHFWQEKVLQPGSDAGQTLQVSVHHPGYLFNREANAAAECEKTVQR